MATQAYQQQRLTAAADPGRRPAAAAGPLGPQRLRDRRGAGPAAGLHRGPAGRQDRRRRQRALPDQLRRRRARPQALEQAQTLASVQQLVSDAGRPGRADRHDGPGPGPGRQHPGADRAGRPAGPAAARAGRPGRAAQPGGVHPGPAGPARWRAGDRRAGRARRGGRGGEHQLGQLRCRGDQEVGRSASATGRSRAPTSARSGAHPASCCGPTRRRPSTRCPRRTPSSSAARSA